MNGRQESSAGSVLCGHQGGQGPTALMGFEISSKLDHSQDLVAGWHKEPIWRGSMQ